jgi:hypothetical protein
VSKVYVVSYDFKEPVPWQLEEFYQVLKSFPAWWHFIEGTWLIKTDHDAKGIYSLLKPFMNRDVNLLILEAGMDAAGSLPQRAWEWIQENRASVDYAKKESLTS